MDPETSRGSFGFPRTESPRCKRGTGGVTIPFRDCQTHGISTNFVPVAKVVINGDGEDKSE